MAKLKLPFCGKTTHRRDAEDAEENYFSGIPACWSVNVIGFLQA